MTSVNFLEEADNEEVIGINGDACIPEQLENVVEGQDVVICAISGTELPAVAESLVTLMGKKSSDRLIFMGAVGIYNEIPNYIDGDDNVNNEPAQIPNRAAVDIIEKSNLNYTVLRPGYLRYGAADDFVLTLKGESAKGYVTTLLSLANLIMQLIEDKTSYSRESISITKDMTGMTKEQMKEAEL